jgi:hypothetical protein
MRGCMLVSIAHPVEKGKFRQHIRHRTLIGRAKKTISTSVQGMSVSAIKASSLG